MELIPLGGKAAFKSLGAPAAADVLNSASLAVERAVDE